MERYSGNPILRPIEEHSWESREVFNPAAIYVGGKVHLLYRAIGNDNISRIGYASSSDGLSIDERLTNPIFQPEMDSEKDGCEDPRITAIDDQLILAYTALSEYNHLQVHQVAISSIPKIDFLAKHWNWGPRRLPFPGIRNKDGVIFPKRCHNRYVMLHRIDPDICIAYSDDLIRWCDLSAVMRPIGKGWDNWKIGVAGTPIEINEGWLVVYHAVSIEKFYSLGIVLLDKERPEQVLYRSSENILAPVADYERFGKVPNVVFSCGNVVLDNKLFLYYGAADSVVCVATIGMDELLAHIPR